MDFITVIVVGLIAIMLVAGMVRSRVRPKPQKQIASLEDCNDYRGWPVESVPGHWVANIPQDGREVFFPRTPFTEPVYEMVVGGVVGYRDSQGWCRLDACYRTDTQGNFTRWHDDLLINGRPFQSYPIKTLHSDRAQHRYKFH